MIDDNPTVKICTCGMQYKLGEWKELICIGNQIDGDEVLELRNCKLCKSTMFVDVVDLRPKLPMNKAVLSRYWFAHLCTAEADSVFYYYPRPDEPLRTEEDVARANEVQAEGDRAYADAVKHGARDGDWRIALELFSG